MTRMIMIVLAAWLLFAGGLYCTPSEPNALEKLPIVNISIKGQKFRLWVVDDFQEQTRGLMYIKAEQMAPLPDGTERGMLFLFDHSTRESFWMKNTIIPLDIAYLSADGRVINTHTMLPLDDRLNQYPPAAPYRHAIEVNAGVWKRLDLKPGDEIKLPESTGKKRS